MPVRVSGRRISSASAATSSHGIFARRPQAPAGDFFVNLPAMMVLDMLPVMMFDPGTR